MSSISLAFVSFVNYFLNPNIGLKVYSKRHNQLCKVSFDTFFRYSLITILNIPFTRVFVNLAEGLLGNDINSESSKYTVIASVSVMILAYVLEVIEKLIAIEVEIVNLENGETKDEE